MIFIPQNSRWIGIRKGTPTVLTVVGIWAQGAMDRYEALSYELNPEGSDEVITIERKALCDLIENKQLTRI